MIYLLFIATIAFFGLIFYMIRNNEKEGDKAYSYYLESREKKVFIEKQKNSQETSEFFDNVTQEYQSQVQKMSKNLGALNAVYELELQDANIRLKNMNKFYAHLTSVMEGIAGANKETEQFKEEIAKLTEGIFKEEKKKSKSGIILSTSLHEGSENDKKISFIVRFIQEYIKKEKIKTSSE